MYASTAKSFAAFEKVESTLVEVAILSCVRVKARTKTDENTERAKSFIEDGSKHIFHNVVRWCAGHTSSLIDRTRKKSESSKIFLFIHSCYTETAAFRD